jgi:CO dehydrogenase maturation factor
VVSGKGGVGKTTLAAAMARILARGGRRVLAVDADAQLNLAAALGIPKDEAEALVPLSRNTGYIEEKTGARPGDGYGLLLRLNPDVDDVVERYGRQAPDGVRFLAMGTLSGAGVGCLCPENTLLTGVIRAIALRPGEAIVMDTQAGVEHFGRAIAQGFDHAVVMTDPT